MAKITKSPLIADIRGSAGPLLFSSSRGISTVRAKKTPTNPNTPAQQASRNGLRDLVSIYGQFGTGLKTVWTNYGVARSMTGVNAFLSQNLAGEIAGGIWSPTPPGAFPVLSVVGDINGNCPGTAMINYLPSTLPAGRYLIIYHRVGNQGDPTLPAMTQTFIIGPKSSPTNPAIPNCADGDNWFYCYLSTSTHSEWGYGFGAPVVL